MEQTTKALAIMGLDINGKIGCQEWKKLGATIGAVSSSSGWWIGDWINYGENRFGEKYTQALDVTQLSVDRLRVCAWVANRYRRERRRQSLSFEVHRELAYLKDEATQDKILDIAEQESWSSTDVREWKRNERGEGNNHTPVLKITIDDEECSLSDEETFLEFRSYLQETCKEYNVKLSRISRPEYS